MRVWRIVWRNGEGSKEEEKNKEWWGWADDGIETLTLDQCHYRRFNVIRRYSARDNVIICY